MATRTRTKMKMLRGVQNERFTFEITSENALVGVTACRAGEPGRAARPRAGPRGARDPSLPKM
jgi:hypothetical protein